MAVFLPQDTPTPPHMPHNPPSRCAMKQARVFRVHCCRTKGPPTAEDFFVKLSNTEHPKKRKTLGVKRVFSRMESNTFLLDVDRTTASFVTAVVRHAFCPQCSVECVDRSTPHEKFLPAVEGMAKEVKLSTIEREAALSGDCSARFTLVDPAQRIVYSYNAEGRLQQGNPEPRGAHSDVTPPADTAQVRSIALREIQTPNNLRVLPNCAKLHSSISEVDFHCDRFPRRLLSIQVRDVMQIPHPPLHRFSKAKHRFLPQHVSFACLLYVAA